MNATNGASRSAYRSSLPLRLSRLVLGALRSLGPRMAVVLGALAILIVLLGPLAFLHEAAAVEGRDMSWHEALYATLGLFTFASNRLGYPQTLGLRLLYFAAPAVSASALLGAFFRLVAERGSLLLGSLEGHFVIGGLGNLGTTLARYLEKHHHAVIAIERQADSPEVADLRASGASVVLIGDMTSPGVLRRARAPWANTIFFVSASDVANLDAAFQVRHLAEHEGLPHPPTIYAHVYDAGLGEALEGQIQHRHERDVRIVPFNSYRFAAKALIGDLLRERLLPSVRVAPGLRLRRTAWPEGGSSAPRRQVHRDEVLDEDRARLLAAFRLEPEQTPEQDQRFAVIGLGRFGHQVLRELLHSASSSARFLLIERSESVQRHSTDRLSPAEVERCEHYLGDATTPAALARVLEFAPSAALICTDSDLSNLRLSVDFLRQSIRTVTRMSGPDASELGRGLDDKGVTLVSLSRLFRASIPILTHERRLQACINLDVHRTPEVDHLFYLAVVNAEERHRLGETCVPLSALPSDNPAALPPVPEDLCLVWHRSVKDLHA